MRNHSSSIPSSLSRPLVIGAVLVALMVVSRGHYFPALRAALKVNSEATLIDGVKAHILTPEAIAPENRNRILLHVHGGCYVSNPGESGTTEAISMAHFGKAKVISIDYRMAPDHVFPAALDDVMTVLKATQKTTPAKNIGVLGTSAGGALVLSMGHRAKKDGVPMPGAIASGTPMADLTNSGDSFAVNALVDNVLIAADASCTARAWMYAAGHDLKDPMLSPVFGDMSGFPPTAMFTGTRDLLLSDTVRVHRKLRQAGVDAVLHVYEGQPHAAYGRDPTSDRKSTRLNSSHIPLSRMPASA